MNKLQDNIYSMILLVNNKSWWLGTGIIWELVLSYALNIGFFWLGSGRNTCWPCSVSTWASSQDGGYVPRGRVPREGSRSFYWFSFRSHKVVTFIIIINLLRFKGLEEYQNNIIKKNIWICWMGYNIILHASILCTCYSYLECKSLSAWPTSAIWFIEHLLCPEPCITYFIYIILNLYNNSSSQRIPWLNSNFCFCEVPLSVNSMSWAFPQHFLLTYF